MKSIRSLCSSRFLIHGCRISFFISPCPSFVFDLDSMPFGLSCSWEDKALKGSQSFWRLLVFRLNLKIISTWIKIQLWLIIYLILYCGIIESAVNPQTCCSLAIVNKILVIFFCLHLLKSSTCWATGSSHLHALLENYRMHPEKKCLQACWEDKEQTKTVKIRYMSPFRGFENLWS